MMEIEKRLAKLEDKDDICRLKAAYLDAADGGWDRQSHDGHGVARLFTPDGVWGRDGLDEAVGQEAIQALFDQSFRPMHFAFHCVTNPSINVDGDMATGHWHVIAMLTHETDGPLLAGCIYTDTFLRTAKGWRFARIHVRIAFSRPMADACWDDVTAQQQFHPVSRKRVASNIGG